MSRTNIQDQLKQANETINNSEFVGDAVNAIVDNQETIVITAFRMLTTLFVGILTVLTAVVSIPFNMFNSDKKILMSLTTTTTTKMQNFVTCSNL